MAYYDKPPFNGLDTAIEEGDLLESIEKKENIRNTPPLINGKGRLYIQNGKPSQKAPDLKGLIILNNQHCFLSGWIRTGKNNKSKYISLFVSDKGTGLDGKIIYKNLGIGFLRFSRQTASKQPSYRGEITIGDNTYSLSAWHASYKGKIVISINSHLINTFSYSEIQTKLKEIEDMTAQR